MKWLRIHSRLGNMVLLCLGGAFTLSSLALLVYYVVTSWGYATMIDRALQILLAVTAAWGAALVLGARQNLKTQAT
ncbi:MAG TPA: hypothetical protein VIL97_11800 [Thermoanaerobaculia bacterium]